MQLLAAALAAWICVTSATATQWPLSQEGVSPINVGSEYHTDRVARNQEHS